LACCEKKTLSVAALSRCFINEEVPQFGRQFVGAGSGDVRKGDLERKLVNWGTLGSDPTFLSLRGSN
jgi:hypothetical protein